MSTSTTVKRARAQSDEIDQMFSKLEQNAETSFLLQQQKNNEMNEAVQQWTTLDGKEEKLYDDLTHETELEKGLREKYEEISKNVNQLGTDAESDEKEFRLLESAFDTDMRTEKTLEQYLTRLIDDVFINQRRLEDIQIGTSRGRANFRQAEKALRDQRSRNRRMSAQISRNTNQDSERVFEDKSKEEEVQKLEAMEKAWDSMEDKIRLKEFELAEESEKVNQKIQLLGRLQSAETANKEKQKQLRIAKDYADLQSHTPMYAAYSASMSLNHNLVERLEIPVSRNSDVKEPITYKSSRTSGTPNQLVEFEDDVDEFPEYSKMNESRKKILRDTEQEAQRVLTHELKELEGIVSGQRQESHALTRDVKWLKENIQLRKTDIEFYTTKAQELIQKARKEDNDKLQSSQQKSQNNFPLDLVTSRGDVLELREKRLILENERNMLTNQIKENGLECDRLNEQWKILKGFAKSVNFDSIRQLDVEIENWQIKVTQLEEQITKLQKMKDYASLANGQLRTNLALLKPYDEEYQEFESLLEANKLLNNQVARQEFRKSVEELKQNGDIDIVF
ncbi:hypothetical protein GCK72_024621 [Caenorhabditis remanei]|uniref:Uncharacterized protein n=1 Tax=Caenorhabditis remanei TaxID=31234 RepID=A0A6A5G0H0_CAERE|nr:hypothetical protein GCK72_024621 [Caenorhabditis remanei]KAF1748154.1 hypothetical protein GCK72_024621 [Caenorhabditis remanei]